MIVSEFITWLKTQDQGATVEIVSVTYPCYGYGQGPDICSVDFDPANHVDYADMRNNPFAKGKPYAESRTLLLGEL
jgi:hypothetical protein